MLLYQIGEIAVGQAVKDATLDLLREGVRTRDLGGTEFDRLVHRGRRRRGRQTPGPAAEAGGMTDDGLGDGTARNSPMRRSSA